MKEEETEGATKRKAEEEEVEDEEDEEVQGEKVRSMQRLAEKRSSFA